MPTQALHTWYISASMLLATSPQKLYHFDTHRILFLHCLIYLYFSICHILLSYSLVSVCFRCYNGCECFSHEMVRPVFQLRLFKNQCLDHNPSFFKRLCEKHSFPTTNLCNPPTPPPAKITPKSSYIGQKPIVEMKGKRTPFARAGRWNFPD